MSRPQCCRRVAGKPIASVFYPARNPSREPVAIVLTLDEFEAIRLADLEGLYQEQAAERMSVSRPTFGRILAAVGYAGIADLDPDLIDLYLDDVHVARQGGRHPQYEEARGQRVMRQSEITVRVHLHRGAAASEVWTCDLSHDYVSINADYRS